MQATIPEEKWGLLVVYVEASSSESISRPPSQGSSLAPEDE